MDTATAKGKLVREIIDGADKIYQVEGGIGTIGVDKIKVNWTVLYIELNVVQNRVENIRYKKSHPASQSPNPDYVEVGSEDDDAPLYSLYH